MGKTCRKHSLLCILIAAVLIAGLWGDMPLFTQRARAVTQADIDAMKDEISGISGKIKDLEKQLAAIANDKAQALEQVRILDEQIALMNSQIASTAAVIQEYDALVTVKEREIAKIEATEAAQYDLFCRQVRSMEEQGGVSYLAILFDATDFSDLLDRAMMISEIMDYNNGIITMLLATRDELQAAKADLEEDRGEQKALQSEQVAAQAELATRQTEAGKIVQSILDKEDGYEDAVNALEAENRRIEAEMKSAEKLLAAQAAGVVSEKGFVWPVPGFYRLTSGFGWRIHPIYGTRRHHNGTDISSAGIHGTKILAAKTGVVTTSAYSSSYGNYVVVSHSDGYQTLYAHMSKRAVSVGKVVKQGEVLGYVGSTGASTGSHLHYEVWYNGERTDAELYYPNLEGIFIRAYNQ